MSTTSSRSRSPRRSAARARAAERVNRYAGADDTVTQFELLTAAAYSVLAARRRRGGDRGGPRRPLRRHERDPVARPGAHERRPRAHELARPDGRRHRPREARRRRPGTHARARRGPAPGRRGLRRARSPPTRGARIIRAPADAGVPLGALGAFQRAQLRGCAEAAAEAFLGTLDARRGRARPPPTRACRAGCR